MHTNYTVMHSLLVFLILMCCWQKEKPTLLLNVVAHVDQHTVIPNAAVAFQGDSMVLVADARRIRLDMPSFNVIRSAGQHVYPAVVASSDSDARYRTPLDIATVLVPKEGAERSLENGSEATLMVTDAALAPGTKVLRIFVAGKPVAVTDSLLTVASANHR